MALWNLDLAFADVVATSSDPHLGAIRLAWWRERLEGLDEGRTPAEPRLQAVASELLPHGITGKELSALEDAWMSLLSPFPWHSGQVEALKSRGRILFGIGARLLGGQSGEAEDAGASWSLADAAAHCSDAQSSELLLQEAQRSKVEVWMPRELRPLTILHALAASDACGEGSLRRVFSAFRHRLTGRLG